MITVNEFFLEAEISRQIDLAHFSNGEVNRLIALLNRVDRDLFIQLMMALENMPADSFTVERLDSLLSSVRILNAQAYASFNSQITADLNSLTAIEVTYQNNLFINLLPAPVQVRFATVNIPQVYAAAMARPMQGRLLKEWAASLEKDRMTRIRDTLRIGYVQGKTTAKMVQEIRGTRAKGYSDGIIEIDRRNAEAVVRTAISHTAAYARNQVIKANDDIILGVVWRSTLDGRTTPLCIARDGKEYDKNYKPVGHDLPWLGGPGACHWNCRSTSTPVLKSWEELGIPGLSEIPVGTRASMDGQVPADMTYSQWLEKQSAARQDEILGQERGRLYRAGHLPIERFINQKGKFLTLEELAAKGIK